MGTLVTGCEFDLSNRGFIEDNGVYILCDLCRKTGKNHHSGVVKRERFIKSERLFYDKGENMQPNQAHKNIPSAKSEMFGNATPYEVAQANLHGKHAYVEALDVGDHVRSFEYDRLGRNRPREHMLMGTLPSLLTRVTRLSGGKPRVYVFPDAFKLGEQEFLSCVDHEQRHALQYSCQPRLFLPPYLRTLIGLWHAAGEAEKRDLEDTPLPEWLVKVKAKGEVDALTYQLQRIDSGIRKVSHDFKKSLEQMLAMQKILGG